MPRPFFQASSPAAQKLEALRQLFPQAIETDAQGHIRINASLLQMALDPANPAGVQVEEDGFELRWVGKREAYHSAFVPVQKIVQPAPQQSQDWDNTGNLLIKGDNLDALRLLRQSYFGQVKLIYIDPPYNTQSDAFIYRDDFSVRQSDVLKALGYSADNIDYIKNIYGARTHSGWLSFMYPRLLLAKDLLRDDGVIFMSIDDNEQAQLKLLCDEVFGEENFVATFPWKKRTAKSDVPFGVSQDFEWVLAYGKAEFFAGQAHERQYFETPDFPNDRWRLSDLTVAKNFGERPNAAFTLVNPRNGKTYPFNPKRVWAVTQDTFPEYLAKGKIVFPGDYDFLRISIPAYRVFESEDKAKALSKHGNEESLKALSTQLPKEVGMSENGNKDFGALFDDRYFSFPKPVGLISHLIAGSTADQDLILDFFAGSGTTGEAVMRLNAEDGGQRRFILVQIPQPIDPKKQKEAHSFVTQTLGRPEATIFEITAERLRRAGAKLQAEQAAKAQAAGGLLHSDTPTLDTGFRVFELVDDPDALILQTPLDSATQADVLALQATTTTPQPQHLPRVLYNLLLAEGLPLSTRIETIQDQVLYRLSDVLAVLHPLPLAELTDTVRQLQQTDNPVRALTVYAPWVNDDNFMLGIHTAAQTLGFSEDKLRLRG
ncbi:MAG: hypothetical protein RLZZ352_1718 [Pseudomonadota bacterium]|jgi:adenine-specific DNA-methyltransferase